MRLSRMITAIEAHAEGEPGRVITGGLPPIPGATVFEKMQWMQANTDDIRQLMLREPRGHPALLRGGRGPRGLRGRPRPHDGRRLTGLMSSGPIGSPGRSPGSTPRGARR